MIHIGSDVWFPVDGSRLGGSGGKTLLEEVHYLGVGFEILNCELLEFVLSVSYLLLMM